MGNINRKEHNVEYLISTRFSKFDGYQSKKGNQGYIKAYISNLWNMSLESALELSKNQFQLFVDMLNIIIIHERYCLERAFQKIKIKGGMCNPCCVRNIVRNTIQYLFDLDYDI